MQIADQRAQAVRETIETVRAIEAKHGVTRETLDRIKPVLVELASRTELFAPESFGNLPGRPGTLFHLAEDPDGRFALYGSAGAPGKAQPPHNHTTWACIAGVYGDEHNVFYDRVDDRKVAGEGRLSKTGELTVVKGNACAFLPDDFHTIEVVNGKESLHLHLYGKTLEDLPERVYFGASTGGPFKRFMSKPEVFAPRITPAELKALIAAGGELAILDPREEGVFAKNHLFLAASCPLSRLEMLVGKLVPRAGTRIVLTDDDEKLAQRAAAVLRSFGYREIFVLAGGLGAWSAAGHELYSGVFVPSKAFGEYIEHHDNTPRISAGDLKAKLDAGEDVLVVDSRPMGEFQVMNIPGALDCPGAELVYRVPELAKSPDTLVVVNCAGRTRSIIGAQSLINAKLPNKVVALKNGTMGWHLAGFSLEHGNRNHAPAPGSEALAKARALAAGVAKRFGIRRIDRAGLARLTAQQDRTTYVFDVRSPEEFAQGHLHGAVNAPGGQLVQATDMYMATRNARSRAGRCGGRARGDDRLVAAADGLARGLRHRGCAAGGGNFPAGPPVPWQGAGARFRHQPRVPRRSRAGRRVRDPLEAWRAARQARAGRDHRLHFTGRHVRPLCRCRPAWHRGGPGQSPRGRHGCLACCEPAARNRRNSPVGAYR